MKPGSVFGIVEVDREARPRAVRSDLRMHDEILNLNQAKAFDGVCDSTEKRRHVSLSGARRVRLGEVFDGPRFHVLMIVQAPAVMLSRLSRPSWGAVQQRSTATSVPPNDRHQTQAAG